MKLSSVRVHNFRSIREIDVKLQDWTLLVGANNSGKSNFIDAIQTFYDKRKFTDTDIPKILSDSEESWIELSFLLDNDEIEFVKSKYKWELYNDAGGVLKIRRYFKSQKHFKENKSNFYNIINNCNRTPMKNLLLKSVQDLILGQVIYIPSLIKPSENLKTSASSPFRDLLNILIRDSINKRESFTRLCEAFEEFCKNEKQEKGFINKIQTPLNESIERWGIKMDIVINSIKPGDIAKLLTECKFVDTSPDNFGLDDQLSLGLENHGGGFQRYVVYALLRIIPTILGDGGNNNLNSELSFNLLLFEEPETFLHPTQQEKIAYELFRLAEATNYQIIASTHSAILLSKTVEDNETSLKKIVRFEQVECCTKVFQIKELMDENDPLLLCLNNFKEQTKTDMNSKNKAERLLKNACKEIKNFRLPLWLDNERSALFFSNMVLLVEGNTEKVLLNYLIQHVWAIQTEYLSIIDVLGKYNFHHFMTLMEYFGIKHGVLFDEDNSKSSNCVEFHKILNEFIKSRRNEHTLAEPVSICCNIESFLGLQTPKRNDLKPLYILKALKNNEIKQEKLDELQTKFYQALNLSKQ